jgi:hypothetical protein
MNIEIVLLSHYYIISHINKNLGCYIDNQLVTNLITALENLSKAVTGSVERESRLKVNDELSKIIDLSSKDRLKAAKLIVCQPEIMDLFFSVLDYGKEEFVRGIIMTL